MAIPEHIQKINEKLSHEDKYYTITEYIDEITKTDNICDIDLIKLENENTKYSVSHNLLISYGVLQNFSTNASIDDLFWGCDIVKGRDYVLVEVTDNNSKYMLTPESFKKILMLKNNETREHYIFIERVIVYYEHYQTLKK